ncbi:MAG: response regulator [Gemmatimonadetes bacterium]|nr:response regulator [Gemmatimonadota bacterium]
MSLNILVVDDSAVMRTMIIRTLKLCGLPLDAIHQAGNGRDGLAVLHEHWVDLALVDINMPVMNGERMLEEVRANPDWSDLPVVVVSTEGSTTRLEHLARLADAFVHKPFTPEQLRDTILRVTGTTHDQLLAPAAARGDRLDF